MGGEGKIAEHGSHAVLELEIPSLYPLISDTHILILWAQICIFNMCSRQFCCSLNLSRPYVWKPLQWTKGMGIITSRVEIQVLCPMLTLKKVLSYSGLCFPICKQNC